MPTHNQDSPEKLEAAKPNAAQGFERTDVGASGIVIFLVALAVLVAVAGVIAFGLGKFLNAHNAKEDGPKSKWSSTVDVRPLGIMPNNPDMQQKLAGMTQNFPAPKVQTDDGFQDVADLHAREDLLLANYSWPDKAQDKIRIPIDRAIQLMAARGLPVAPTAERAPLLTGEVEPQLVAPLTTGFVRTGYEQELDEAIGRKPKGK